MPEEGLKYNRNIAAWRVKNWKGKSDFISHIYIEDKNVFVLCNMQNYIF